MLYVELFQAKLVDVIRRGTGKLAIGERAMVIAVMCDFAPAALTYFAFHLDCGLLVRLGKVGLFFSG